MLGLARTTTTLHKLCDFEHTIIVLTRSEREAVIVHVIPNGEAYYGVSTSREQVAGMREFVAGFTADDEIDLTEAGRELLAKIRSSEAPPEERIPVLLSSFALTIGEQTGASGLLCLARDIIDSPGFSACRYDGKQAHYFDVAPDFYLCELVMLNEFASKPAKGSMPKPSLQAASVGASYTFEITPELKAALDENRQAFIEKFGREPRDDDPVFFDPDADEPVPISAEKAADLEAQFSEHGFDQQWSLQRQALAERSGLLRRTGKKQGRNDLCRCGSGRKYKRCCGS